MSKLPYEVVDQKMRFIELSFLNLSFAPKYGFNQKIVSVTPLRRSKHWPADYEIIVRTRKRLRKLFLFIDIGPSRPLSKSFKRFLEQCNIKRLFFSAGAGFKSIFRELAQSLKAEIYGPPRRSQNSKCSRSFHQQMTGARLSHC